MSVKDTVFLLFIVVIFQPRDNTNFKKLLNSVYCVGGVTRPPTLLYYGNTWLYIRFQNTCQTHK